MTSLVEKALRLTLVVALVFGVCATPSFAQKKDAEHHTQSIEQAKADNSGWRGLAAIAAGLVTIGGAFGIGKLAAAAMEGTARQPEAGGDIRTSMIIAAALIEGFTFFALIVCMQSI